MKFHITSVIIMFNCCLTGSWANSANLNGECGPGQPSNYYLVFFSKKIESGQSINLSTISYLDHAIFHRHRPLK